MAHEVFKQGELARRQSHDLALHSDLMGIRVDRDAARREDRRAPGAGRRLRVRTRARSSSMSKGLTR